MLNFSEDVERLMDAAMAQHQAGRLAEAEGLYRQALARNPKHGDALHLLGVLAYQVKRYDIAAELIGRAIAIVPNDPAYHSNYANVLKDSGRLEEAIAEFQRAVALRPEFAEVHSNLGNALREAGRWEEALASCQRAASLKPENAAIQHHLGNALNGLGRLEEAVVCYQKSLALQPNDAEAHSNLGAALKSQGEVKEAIGHFRKALALRPEYAEALSNLGDALREMGDWEGAIAACGRAAALNPNLAEAHSNLGDALKNAGREEEAIACYEKAISLRTAKAEAHNSLGGALKEKGRLEEAIACFEKALALRPDFAEACSNLGTALRDAGLHEEGLEYCRRAVKFKPKLVAAHSNLNFSLLYHPDYDAELIREANEDWNRRHAEPLRGLIREHQRQAAQGRRLRIGYVSGDFWEHVVARNILPLFRERDRERFEVICYYNGNRHDAVTEELQGLADGWREIGALSDEQAAEQVREDGIDILVDLSLHTAGNRLLIFARKPSPVQVTFAGYPGSTGLKTIDYRLTDHYLDPAGENDQDYSERSIRLESFWCYEARGDEPEVNELPALTSGEFTFGCLNNFSKVNDGVLRLWAEVLRRVDKSRLLLLAPDGKHRERALKVLRQEGVASDRVEFAGPRPRTDYLRLYHRIDLGLDTVPYNGHTTSLDSYYMGVPVVTLAGKTVVGRAGVSQLTHLGLADWAASNTEEYVEIAVRMANDTAALAKLRSTLRETMRGSVLMDARGFARNIEHAYEEMWERWEKGLGRIEGET